MKYHYYFIIFFNINFTISFALPRFAIQNGVSCIACHINPTGSSMRNDYGSNVVALEELPFKKWIDKGDEDWDGYITDHLQIGGDFRLQSVQYNDINDNTRKSALFPMQAEIYAYLKLNKNAGVFAKLGIPRRGADANKEYWVLINNLPQNAWFRIGRTLPNYGLKVDDHTSFIRGGNINKTKIGLNSNVEGSFQIGVEAFKDKNSSIKLKFYCDSESEDAISMISSLQSL